MCSMCTWSFEVISHYLLTLIVLPGNFYRIRSAFALGAKKNWQDYLIAPVKAYFWNIISFFMNTWERHGSGIRSNAPEVNNFYH